MFHIKSSAAPDIIKPISLAHLSSSYEAVLQEDDRYARVSLWMNGILFLIISYAAIVDSSVDAPLAVLYVVAV